MPADGGIEAGQALEALPRGSDEGEIGIFDVSRKKSASF
jgi:hypothetical protein